ncbi:hypothetical protein ACH4S8_37895 [Streptomyces sp. NPDC021080]|uniref:hypothetical protein n=1 Tax=Streptomyces sp. NPDC021080 TaxID=3365110 RepID=UPI00379D4183
MRVLPPEEYRVYVRGLAEDYFAALGQGPAREKEEAGPPPTGQVVQQVEREPNSA